MAQRRMTGRRGMSLAEALVTSFCLLLALSMVAALGQEYTRAMAFSAEKDKVLAGARTVFDTLRGDVEAAYELNTSAPDKPVLKRIRHDLAPAFRLGATPVNPPGLTAWQPWSPAWEQQVDYRLQGETIIRRAGQEYSVATGLSGFSVTENSADPGGVWVVLTFLEANQRVRTLRSLIVRRVGQEPYR